MATEAGYFYAHDSITSGPNFGGFSAAQYKASCKDRLEHTKVVVGRNGRSLIADTAIDKYWHQNLGENGSSASKERSRYPRGQRVKEKAGFDCYPTFPCQRLVKVESFLLILMFKFFLLGFLVFTFFQDFHLKLGLKGSLIHKTTG